jgi:hypothetical protein
MSEVGNLAEWQKFIAKQFAENPEGFKKAMFPLGRGYWKRQAQNDLYAKIAISELIKGETK